MKLHELSCVMLPLLLHLLLLTSSGRAASWISTASCTNGSISCTCDRIGKSLLGCHLISGSKLPAGSVACSEVKIDKISDLNISCAGFSHCAVLQLSQLVYNTSLFHLRVSHCQFDWPDLNRQQPRLLTNFSLIPDGLISLRSAAGFLYTEASGSAVELASLKCSLRKLQITDTELRFPASLLYNCLQLERVKIANCLLLDLTDADVLAMSITKGLSVTGCELHYFGDGLMSQVLTQMTQPPLRVNCINEKCRKYTDIAKRVIDLLLKEHSPITDVRKLYATMDNISTLKNFRLLVGHMVDSRSVPSPLIFVDLSNNLLERIPSSLSLLGNMEVLNLSRNQISYLYDGNGCWGGPPSWMPLEGSKSKQQCYWFRAAKQSLKNLDLSHNMISFLGEKEPWYEIDLWTLNLSYNRIKLLGTDAFAGSLSGSLYSLLLDNNSIESMELSCLSKLLEFSANKNRLTCIKNETLPSSKALQEIRLSGNRIESIAPAVFKKYARLRKLDLSDNCLARMPAASLETSSRQAISDRVSVKIRQQTTCPLICDCQHFFAKALLEEQSDDHVYTMPAVSNEEREKVQCQLIARLCRSHNVTRELQALQPNDFGCQFRDYSSIELPKNVCARNGTACIGKCNPSCLCWANDNEMIMNCSVHGYPRSAKDISLPITVLDFSMVRVSFFQALSNWTLTWQHNRDRQSLREFHASNSGIVSIEDYAFGRTTEVTKIYVPHNKIKRLTKHTFSGLESSLSMLNLHNNNLSTVRISIFKSLEALSHVTLHGNPFICSCSERHLSYLAEMAEYSGSKSVISDYNVLTCKLTEEFVKTFNGYHMSQVYSNVSLTEFPMQNVDFLKKICHEIENRESQLVLTIIKTSLITIGISAALVAAIMFIRRRHFICSLVALSFLVRIAGRRARQSHRSKQYHLFVYCAEGNSNILENMLDTMTKASNTVVGEPVQVCTTCSFLISEDPQSTQSLCEIESIELAVLRSEKVMVVLSEELFRMKTRELLVISQELGTRRLWKDLILMRLESSSDVAYQLSESVESLNSRQEREGMEVWMRILLNNQTVLYGSLDWQYKLINLIFDQPKRKPDEHLDRNHGELRPLIGSESNRSTNARDYSVTINA